MLTDAHKFISLVLPQPTPDKTSYINVHWSSNFKDEAGRVQFLENGKLRKIWGGRASTTVDKAIENISMANRWGDKDIYLCMSTQSVAEEKTSAKGHKYLNAVRSAESVSAIRSFYIDIDVKEEAYDTTEAAYAALFKFIADTGLPTPSAVVLSGSGGFHVHWATDRDLTPQEWFPVAFALAAAVIGNGVIADTQCTVDIARILRVPGTMNRKTDEAKEVVLDHIGTAYPYEVIRAALAQWEGVYTASKLRPSSAAGLFEDGSATAAAIAKAAVFSGDTTNGELGENLNDTPLTIRADDVVKQCGFLAKQLGTGGKDTPQPLWFMTALACQYIEDGREVFHAMSEKHPGYSPTDADTMFDRLGKRNQKGGNYGWPQCEKISVYGAEECKTCPLLARKKSPLNFARDVAAVSVAEFDDTLPTRYKRTAEGIIVVEAVDDDGTVTRIPICHYPIHNGWLSNNPWSFHFTTKMENGRKTGFEIPTEVIFAKDGFSKYLGSKGMFCTDAQYKQIKEFFVSWLQKLQNTKDGVISAAPFGWSVVDGKVEGFAYASRVWMPDSDRPAANPNPVLQYQYTPKGNADAWMEAAKVIYEQKRPALDAILAVAFAGPLVRFTGFGGLILNAYSPESGIGKTTAMKVSQSVWANPVLAMQGLNDTSNSVLNKMGHLKSLPVYWDEIKSEAQVKRFCSIVFDLTGGREKTRLNSDSTLKTSGTWQTLMVSASNDTLIDGMAREVGSTTAGLHRLFEYTVSKPETMSRDVGAVQRLLGKLDDNFGHAGLTYAKFLGKHFARVEREVAAAQDSLYSRVNVKQEERMWIATMAVILKGADYANELKLTNIDTAALEGFLMGVLTHMRGEVDKSPSDMSNEMSVSTVLAEFLNSTRNRNTITTSRIWIAKGKPPKGAITIISDTSKLGEFAVQIGRDDRIIRISSVFLSRWMNERGYSRHTFVKKLESEFGVKTVNGKLGGGTEMASAMEYLIELDMNDPKLSKILD